MKRQRALNLVITPEGVDAFCERLRRSSANPSRAVAGLATLQTFLAETAAPAEKVNAGYHQIRERLAKQLEAAAGQVIIEAAGALTAGIARREPAAIATVHQSLSRSGFQQAVARAAASEHFGPDAGVTKWAARWCREAERKAEAASGYPDAFDFSAAGIVPEQYAAMRDLRDGADF